MRRLAMRAELFMGGLLLKLDEGFENGTARSKLHSVRGEASLITRELREGARNASRGTVLHAHL